MPLANGVVRKAFDYKYSDSDWRKDPVETFQKTQEVRTRYTVADGHLVRKIAQTTSYASAIARVADDIINGPPYFYADNNFHADVWEPFQLTRIVTTDYEALSSTSYKVTIDDFDVLNNKHKFSTEIIDGLLPLATTIQSNMTSLTQRPIVGQLLNQCEWVDNTTPLDLPWVEGDGEMQTATMRQLQRDTAIVRTFTAPWNPLLRVGMTARLIHAMRGIDSKDIV